MTVNSAYNERMKKQAPYLTKTVVTEERMYNPEYGDEHLCVCGHTYYRHFDTYEDMEAVGCKYCECYTFTERTGDKK